MKKVLFLAALMVTLFTGFSQEKKWVNGLVFKNNSLKSIPLTIPGVMNPNLSPLSTSGVSIPEGTVVSFFYKKKKYELVTITSDMEKTVIVNELIERRKKELSLD
jgi:hypothetical protein